MTHQQIKYARLNEKLMLSRWDSFSHFKPVFFLVGVVISIPAFKIYHTLNGRTRTYNKLEIMMSLVMLFAAFLIYLFQKHRLNFSWIKSALPHEATVEIIKEVAVELNWSLQEVHSDFIIAMTKAPFLSESSGERVTIVFDSNKLLINILDVDFIWLSKSSTDINYLFAAIEQQQYLSDYPTL
jgi:hypothetical protein